MYVVTKLCACYVCFGLQAIAYVYSVGKVGKLTAYAGKLHTLHRHLSGNIFQIVRNVVQLIANFIATDFNGVLQFEKPARYGIANGFCRLAKRFYNAVGLQFAVGKLKRFFNAVGAPRFYFIYYEVEVFPIPFVQKVFIFAVQSRIVLVAVFYERKN